MNEICKKEDAMASDWNKISSIPGIAVDWEYEPESSLGNRLWKRLQQSDLQNLLDAKNTPVKMITADAELKGRLVDVSQKGLGVFFETPLPVGVTGKIGFPLGKQTIVSQAVTKNSVRVAINHRVGLEFVGLGEQMEDYIIHLVSSGGYGRV
ncbi:MAG: hypothetical protein ACI8ZB_002445 [Desulforhopalus sp.]|jgi:hypothetical protein